ncbi:MAG: hypothetical protein OXF05_01635, partial [Hyphomicrobiales bacterium]|nr:hypothetical protein [Hyphomicrobiales bacterium]
IRLLRSFKMSKETEKLTPEEVMQVLQDHEVHCERRQKGIVDQFTQTKEQFTKNDDWLDRLEIKIDNSIKMMSSWLLIICGIFGLYILCTGFLIILAIVL